MKKFKVSILAKQQTGPYGLSRADISLAALLPSAVIHSVAHHKQTELVLSDA